MTNVLPLLEKKRLRQTVVSRIVIVASLACVVVGMVGMLALVPAYVSVHVPRVALANLSNANANATSSADRDTVARFKLLVKELAGLVDERQSLGRALALLDEHRPKGVALDMLYYRSGSPGTLVVSGSVSKRDLVGEYRVALEKAAFFTDISVPVAALVGTSAGSFTMTLTGNF
jgi:hypothetical protein